MFIHNFYYSLKAILRAKEPLFWSGVFPIALATFMFMAFGKIYESQEVFHAVDVAIVENTENETFMDVVDTLSKGNEPLLVPLIASEQEAVQALKDKKVFGIIYVDDDISLEVQKNGYEETVLKVFLENYLQDETLIHEIIQKDPSKVQDAIDVIASDMQYYKEISTSDGNQNVYVSYFYAVLAMSCLFSGFNGLDRVLKLQADFSALGQRRSVAPTHKMVVILSEFSAALFVQFMIGVTTFMYMWGILGIDFGSKWLALIGIIFLGNAMGISIGMAMASIPKIGEGVKIGVLISVSMLMSILADLCASGVRNTIEHKFPLINRINPAALVVDSFYSLNVYDNYERYGRNMLSLGVVTIIFCTISFLLIRRNRYASL